MLQPNHIYTLKSGIEVKVLQRLTDYFGEEEYVVFSDGQQTQITTERAFQANLKTNQAPQKKYSITEKIALYRSYFRGREDIVAYRYVDKRTDKAGWVSPWCWSRNKYPCPRAKNKHFPCSSCTVSNFVPLTDERIHDHLRGKTTKGYAAFYGIYPIFNGNQVYFLALDFDKKNWRDEASIVVETAESLGLHPLLELSQSGNGCHIWFFFQEAVTAKEARRLGKGILRLALANDPGLDLDSFDRMFPNQEETSDGGFGNLIALPLQGKRVVIGSSRFINKNFEMIDDVWGTLAATPKISRDLLNNVLQQMPAATPVEYFRPTLVTDTSTDQIDLFTVAEGEGTEVITEAQVTVLWGSHLSIARAQLTNEDIVKLRYLATFNNKAYTIAKRKRLPTYNIPKKITLAQIDETTLYLPRGLVNQLENRLPNLELIDQRSQGQSLAATFIGELYPAQQVALTALAADDYGVLKADTGFGKTVTAAKLIADKKVSTLILVHNKTLADQWQSSLENFLEIAGEPFPEYTPTGRLKKKTQIGKIYGGKELRSGLIDIALFQSLAKRDDLEELFSQYGMVIVDEAHHISAVTFEEVVTKVSSKYLYGLTATPEKDDGLENILFMRVGEVVYEAHKEIPLHIQQNLYLRFTGLGEQERELVGRSIHEYYEMMLESDARNQLLLADIKTCVVEKRHVILLTRYVKHLDRLKELIEAENIDVPLYVLNSKIKSSELRQEFAKLKDEGRPFILLTTGSYAGEGFDLPALDTLLLAMPNSGAAVIKQYLGRLQRNLDEKEELRVYDYVDYAIPTLFRMYQKRMRVYRKLDYQILQDNQTQLQQSNFFGAEYQPVFAKDLQGVNHQVNLYVTFPTRSLVEPLRSLDVETRAKVRIGITPLKKISEDYRSAYREGLDKLVASGIEIHERYGLSGNYAVIDEELVWLLPQSSGDGEVVAMRLFSKQIAGRVRKRFR